MTSSPLIDQTIAEILELDPEAMAAARARQDTLTKPLGSLGRLEDLSVQLAGIFGQATPQIRRKSIILAAGDHGVVAEGVSAYPQDVTPAMVMNFLGGAPRSTSWPGTPGPKSWSWTPVWPPICRPTPCCGR